MYVNGHTCLRICSYVQPKVNTLIARTFTLQEEYPRDLNIDGNGGAEKIDKKY